MLRNFQFLAIVLFLLAGTACGADQQIDKFLTQFCVDCHSGEGAPTGLDFTKISHDLKQSDVLRQWVKLHDQVAAHHMPPEEADQPTSADRDSFVRALHQTLMGAEQQLAQDQPRLRRLTRTEYENTIRDLFDMPGIALSGNLPADGEAHGFDKVPEALDISHVNVAKYLEAADHVLDYAIATRPEPPAISTRRISLVNRGGFVAHIVMNGDGVLLKNGQPDPEFPPAGEQNHLDQGAHERWGSFDNGASVGLFRHEDESVSPYFIEHVTIYPACYRVRTSLWSFGWDQGTVLPGRGTEAARLSVVQLTGDGRGGQHPSYVLGYFNAPVGKPLEHEVVVWLNHNELIGFNTASLAPAANYYKKKRAMEFTGPGIVVDWLDIEGPLYDEWPPASHKLLFGDLPLVEFKQEEHPGVQPPDHKRPRQLGAGMNRPDPEPGIWTVHSDDPIVDANRLLASALPKLFRRPVSDAVRQQYVNIVQARLDAGDCFELAMRMAYRSAMVSPDFLYHIDDSTPVEQAAKPDVYALACRLSYFLWNSAPDERLVQLATSGELRRPEVLHAEVERMLRHPHAKRFVDDFLGQWLKLYDIAATDPDKKLYPEFSPYLQDCMVAETRAYFRELLEQDLDVSHLLKSEFLMLNQKLATHYGIPDVTGTQVRRVPLPAGCPRGGLVTQASILKITANGTTTSPVPRGAFVLDRLLGKPPEPPPSNVSAIEPDVQGATTIREQLAKHRDNALCASCHQKIDPPGFALEAFDVIGGFRTRYRSIGEGDPAERGAIDPFIGIGFRLGKDVDASGELPDGQTFADIQEFQNIATTNSRPLLENLAQRFVVYSTGQTVRFSDRPALASIVDRTLAQNGGVRTLLHEVIGSPLFSSGLDTAIYKKNPADAVTVSADGSDDQRMLMTSTLPAVTSPAVRSAAEEQPAPPAPDYTFDDEHSVTVRVVGLFIPERADAFRELIQRFSDVELKSLDVATAEATIQCAAESGTFKNANADQIIERLNNMVRQASTGLFSVKPMGELPHDQLQQIEFDIIGLDCKACSLAVHDILLRNNGVIHATASFKDGKAIAWIDPAQTNHDELVMAMKKSNVTLKEAVAE